MVPIFSTHTSSLAHIACKKKPYMSYETSINSTYDYLVDNCPRNVDDLKKTQIEWSKIRIVLFEKSDDWSLITMKYKVDFND